MSAEKTSLCIICKYNVYRIIISHRVGRYVLIVIHYNYYYDYCAPGIIIAMHNFYF